MAKLLKNCLTCRHGSVMSCAEGSKPTLFGGYGFRRFRDCALAYCFFPRKDNEVKWYDSCEYYEFSIFNRVSFVDYDNSEVISKIFALRKKKEGG